MLPEYPKFKELEITDKNDVESITSKYPPYSDFNFVSLWSYNTKNEFFISKLNDNLVVKLLDYLKLVPFYSFIGDNSTFDTISKLLNKSVKESLKPSLRLIPEDNLKKDRDEITKRFKIKEDKNNYDYILSLKDLSELRCHKFFTKRKLVKRFHKMYPNCKIEEIEPYDKKQQTKIIDLFMTWQMNSKKKYKDIEVELTATKRLLESARYFNLFCMGIFDNNKLISYSIEEPLNNGFVMGHFGKADINYLGIYQTIQNESATHLFNKGYKYLNKCVADSF